jgi:hypothetical protein
MLYTSNKVSTLASKYGVIIVITHIIITVFVVVIHLVFNQKLGKLYLSVMLRSVYQYKLVQSRNAGKNNINIY